MLSVPFDAAQPCARAVVGGRWRDVLDRPRAKGTVEARLVGRWFTQEGQLVGYWRGFTGHRRNGDEVIFAKVIDPDGAALALLKGTIQDNAATLDVVTTDEEVAGSVHVTLDRDGAVRAHIVAVAEMARCLAPANAQ